MKFPNNTSHVSRVGGLTNLKFKKFLRMDKNERIDHFSKTVIDNFRRSLSSEDIINYPKEENLVENISKNFNIQKNKILITPGSDAGLKYIFETFIKKDSVVATLSPSYAMFEFYCQLYKCKISKIFYEDNFEINFQDFNKILKKKLKLIYIANPNQPSGTSLKKKHIENILKFTKKKNILVIIDEAYIDFSSQKSSINLVNKYENLIVLRTFSKGFGSAGLRVGYLVSNFDNVNEVNKVRPLHNINSLGIKFASYLLKNKSIIRENVSKINQSKIMLYKFCKNNNLDFLKSDTNFVNIFFTEKKVRR